MADTTEVLQHPAVRAYLTEVHRAVAAKDPAAADGVLAGVADHIRDAAADAFARGDRFDSEAVLSELGDPALIAADIDPVRPNADAPPARFADAAGAVVLTTLLLSVGTWMFTVFGWAAGIWLLWSSRRWTRTDKIIATLWWPVLVLIAWFGARLSRAGVVGWHLAIVVGIIGSIGIGVWLVVRAGRGRPKRPRSPRRSPVARPGALGLLDRWPGAAVVVAAPVLAIAAFAVPVLVTGSWGSLPLTASIAGIVMACGIAVTWTSRGWAYENRVWRTGTTLLTVFIAGLLTTSAMATTNVLRRCGSDGCEELAPRLADPAVLVHAFAAVVLPALALHAITTASTFRSGAAVARRLDGRGAAIAIVLVLLAGTAGITLVVQVTAGWTDGLPWAIAAAALWSVGVVLVARSAAWQRVDLVAAIVPALVVTWLCIVGSPVGPLVQPDPRIEPVNPLLPPPLAVDGAVVLLLLLTVQLAASGWLLTRAGVFRRAANA